MSRKVFIDCGYNIGEITKKFLDKHEDSKSYEIFAFEPNVDLKNINPTIQPIRKLVWIEDGTIDFQVGKRHNATNSRVQKSEMNKKAAEFSKSIKVETIDFSKWLAYNFTSADYILLKMNIEGAEYDVIDKMYKDKTLYMIDAIFMSAHAVLFNDGQYDINNRIVSCGVKLFGAYE